MHYSYYYYTTYTIYIYIYSLQMKDVLRRFKEASPNCSVTISSLQKIKEYPVLRAERVETKYGVSILLTVRESSVDVVRVYLPKRYTDVFTDPNIISINDGTLKFNLIYHGVCEKTNAFLLSLSNDSPCKHGISFCFLQLRKQICVLLVELSQGQARSQTFTMPSAPRLATRLGCRNSYRRPIAHTGAF
jgi:hypothetical protein